MEEGPRSFSLDPEKKTLLLPLQNRPRGAIFPLMCGRAEEVEEVEWGADRKGEAERAGETDQPKDLSSLAANRPSGEARVQTAGNYTPIICPQASAGIN